MANLKVTPAPSAAEPLVDEARRPTRSWYRWFTQFVGEALSGVVTDVVVTPPLSGSGTGSGGSTGGSSGVVTIGLGPSGVTPGTYGDASHVGQFTVNASGILTFAQNVAIAGAGAGQYMPVVVGGLCVTMGDTLVAVAWEVPTS